MKTEVNSLDLRLLLISSFRYALGRRSYIVSATAEAIKTYSHVFTNKEDFMRFVEEINEAEDLGDNMDKETWEDLKKFCEEKIIKIRNKEER